MKTTVEAKLSPTGNPLSAEQAKMIDRNAALIPPIARRMLKSLPRHVDIRDIEQEGMIGLIDGVKKFNSNVGVAEATYLAHRIRGAILDSLRKLDFLSKQDRSIVHRVETLKAELSATDDLNRLGALLEKYKMTEEEFERGSLFSSTSFIPLQITIGDDGSGEDEVDLYVSSSGPSPEAAAIATEINAAVKNAILQLSPRYQYVIINYYWHDKTLKEIGDEIGIDHSRASQIRKAGLEKINKTLTAKRAQLQQLNSRQSSGTQ